MRSVFLGSALILCTLPLAGCLSSSSSSDDATDDSASAFSLQLLHFADVDGGGTAAMFNVDQFSALVDHFRSEMPDNTLLLSSGDNYIPGPIFQASGDPRMNAVVGVAGDGRGETQIQNQMGLQASAVGNHDLDTGPAGFAGIIKPDGDYSGALYPYLSANIDFSTDSAIADLMVDGGQEASSIAGKVAPSAVITVNGERIGLVGAVTPTLPSITSVGNLTILPQDFAINDESSLDNLAAVIQEEVNALRDDDINKIILLSHMQVLSVEKGLATRLEGVDIIVGGGSNTLLANNGDLLREGDSAADDYPLMYTSPANEPVLLVNTDADYKYLGRLLVDFDDEGVIILDSINNNESGAWASLDSVVDTLQGSPISDVTEVADVIRQILGELDGTAYGVTDVFLDGRRAFVRSRETNLGNLSADANLWYAREMLPGNPPLVSVKNGGGIRAPIGRIVSPAGSTSVDDLQLLPPAGNDFGKPEGGVSQLDIQTAFAFNNGLALITMTAAELHDLTEEMIKGNFTHTAGLRLSFNPNAQARSEGDTNLGLLTDGERVIDLDVLVDPNAVNEADRWDRIVENGAVVGDPNRTFRVVALDFLANCAAPPGSEFATANCGSAWPFKGLNNAEHKSLLEVDVAANDPGQVDFSSTGGEQDALAEFLLQFHPDSNSAYAVPFDVNERLIPVTP
ncbi:bifunctional metallophosphatase/5'-nucleotidase [Halopseudomonas salegens]|uniref:2',3'-cyclic-nucleotide 2'-phosphodiesterase/5'-or 3'-nucleotidase, 5'-nucleotidase family n=1 Tax=Halopseudomonas salegens TaxID=1434072 RepID=A0A1H2F9E2_9GAMM|nr:bifunctional metallophosphatase/5'-nucleotidase [Halopseudomonas salegens]SDU04006.1 2',3'-cyclic-nucleotide 2'-phosphodiesterase/5'-or 3'-nucleotidase, 5'-nucleotidase family [Halopseudomonas salegens]